LARLDPERLDYELRRRGLTYTALAERSGVHATHLSRLRQGKRGATAGTLRRIAAALEATPIIPGAELLMRPGATP
jgi:transcriptional regulator with XRE-family HTH domain